jgi:protoporphyrinogen oxidase
MEKEDRVLSELSMLGRYFELISTIDNEKYIYSNGKRFRYGFKVSDNAKSLRNEGSMLIILNEDNSEDTIEI